MEATYVDHMGDDLRVVNAARVSFSKESKLVPTDIEQFNIEANTWFELTGERWVEWDISEQDKKLIKYLAKHNHWTPFSHPQITMQEKVPIFVARQRFKHMVGFTYNEVSRRYVDDTPEFYMPSAWRSKPEGSIKQGSGVETITKMQVQGIVENRSGDVNNFYFLHLASSEHLYNSMLKAGIAPEQARMVLPQSMYTEYYVTGSLAAWARAYKQRIDPHAQLEIRELAKQWDAIIRPKFPVSWGALVD
jgi:thymidylate synthase (FAD)